MVKELVNGADVEKKVMCKFMPFTDDITWASKSILARLKNDFCLYIVQQAFVDVGFVDFKLISLGEDNVVLHPGVEGDAMELFKAAADFIGNFLDDCRPWMLDSIVNYERGAWVRCYGVPLHVWNDIFFLELAATQGRLLKIDDCTTNKDRLDYARLLISTPSLKEINVIEKVWIDGRMFPIRIIEDFEFGFAEDDNNSQCSVSEGFQEEDPIVDTLVQQLQDDWVTKAKEDQKANSVTVHQHSSSCQPVSFEREVKENSSNPIVQHVAKCIEGTTKSNPCNISINSQHSKKRRKVVPSMTGLKRIARLSATDRNDLIRSLKSSKKKKKVYLCLQDRDLLLILMIGKIGCLFMVMLRGWRLIF